jgi:hypothetical protein
MSRSLDPKLGKYVPSADFGPHLISGERSVRTNPNTLLAETLRTAEMQLLAFKACVDTGTTVPHVGT